MTKKNLMLIVFAIALAIVYAVWFTDWFRPARVQVFHTSRDLHRGGGLPSLIFGVNRPLQITELKVVMLTAFATNKNVLPLWHLVSDSNSVPVKLFTYGQFIRGMRPAINGVHAEPLETNVPYRLLITAGKIKGEHDFDLK